MVSPFSVKPPLVLVKSVVLLFVSSALSTVISPCTSAVSALSSTIQVSEVNPPLELASDTVLPFSAVSAVIAILPYTLAVT